MAEYEFKIIKKIGEISKTKGGWTKEINIISWHGGDPKYDIREWSPDHKTPSKGVVLSTEEFYTLKGIISTIK